MDFCLLYFGNKNQCKLNLQLFKFMRILIYTGYHNPKWNPLSVDKIGLGGTEQCVLNLAKQLSSENEVYVVGDVIEGTYDNVIYFQTETALKSLENKYIDCVIGVSYINYLLHLSSLNFNHSLFWVHNTDFYSWHNGQQLKNHGRYLLQHEKLTQIICLTNWHKNSFAEKYPEIKNKIKVIGNGVNTNSFVESTQKIKNSFIYTSHSERGLQIILKEWSNIVNKLPDATLHISTPEYGLEYFHENYSADIKNMKSVFFHGSLPIKKLYELMAQSEYWYYPTDYEETFCITALEMLGHEVKPIANKIAGLKETLNDFNLNTFDDLQNKIDFNLVRDYIKKCDWSNIKKLWTSHITMNKQNIQTVKQSKEIDCVYVISLTTKKDLLENWKTEIRTKMLPWYLGPIVCKRGVNGKYVDQKWLNKNNYQLYDNWKIDQHDNSYWSNDLTKGEIGCAISHHQVWVHAFENNFSNILILEEDFSTVSQVSKDVLNKIPSDYDLFYLGRNPLYTWWKSKYEDEPVGDGTIVKPAPSFNAHAYMLSQKGIKSLLDQNFHSYLFPVDDFFIACSNGHIRNDLNFIHNDLITYAVTEDLVSQNRPSEDTGPRTYGEHRKHSDLYTYFDNPNEWKEKFIAYSARTKEWDLIIDEPFDNCFSMPLFTKEFCEKIREEAEYADSWTTDRHEYYPTTDMLLDQIDMTEIYYDILKEYVFPACKFAFQLDGQGWDDMESEDFLAKYTSDAQGHLSLHHDHSNITALVTLSSFDEYEGGGTWFSHQKKLIKEKQGYVSIHPGNITHKHGARATTNGKRYIIVSFMKNMQFMK